MDQSTAVWNGTYDPAKVGAVYASDAAFVDNIEGETSTGLSAILAKINDCLTSSQFTVKAASAPVQYGDTVVSIVNYGTGGTTTDTALAVIKVKDGKIIRHTVYPLP